MEVRRRPIVTALVLFSLILASVAFGGVTGKVTGRIIDQKTGTPIPGANILVAGTALGAVSDLNGDYIILHVPPGSYSVRASILGYSQTVVQGVEVRIDQTSDLTVRMSPEVIKGETVTVVAERKAVKPDVTTSVTSVTSQELIMLPVSNVQGVVGMQAGIRGLDIRGSSSNSSLFMVDGITMRDPRRNQPIATVPMNAVEAISIERGGFSAEYGQVQSGIINVVTREGSKNKYQVSAEFKASPAQKKYFGISPYDRNSFWMRPYLDDAVAWQGTVAGWDKIHPASVRPVRGMGFHLAHHDDQQQCGRRPLSARRPERVSLPAPAAAGHGSGGFRRGRRVRRSCSGHRQSPGRPPFFRVVPAAPRDADRSPDPGRLHG
jgi:hypothetical protein